MDTIVIGKPAMNVYLSLVEFPKEGDVFNLPQAFENVGNVSATASILLAKWGIKNHFTGVIGNDDAGEKIRETFNKYKIDIKYVETDYTHKTATNYIVIDNKKGTNAKVICMDNTVFLQRYKYDFVPTYAILDSTDSAGAIALLNNNPNCTTFFYGRVGDEVSVTLSKKCKYVICTQRFAEDITKSSCDGSAESCVSLFQHIVDSTGSSNYIVIMNNHKILYSESNQVKMLPALKLNNLDITSFDSVFTGAFAFAMILESKIDDAIKFANMAASLSASKLGEEASIPTLDEVLENSGLKDRISINNINKTEDTSVSPATQPEPVIQNTAPVETVPQDTYNSAFNTALATPNVQPVAPQAVFQTETQPVQPMNPQPVNQPIKEESNIFDV